MLLGGVLIFGLQTTVQACTTAIAICIVFYGSSKVLVYLFLVEKVCLVWSPRVVVSSRLCSPVYLVCKGTMLYRCDYPYDPDAVHSWRDDGTRIIGLKAFSSIPLLTFNLPFLTESPPSLAQVNIGVLTVQHGRQLDWVCLGSCGTDVVLNAFAVFWVTRGSSDSHFSGGNDKTAAVVVPEARHLPNCNSKVISFSLPATWNPNPTAS
ncbi:hypothetical protein V5O48_004195 [Marasmius crinis-equi]|uniref:Uncharacterized protein n=1 Tax=Marasmius crinis-equi TaxID=585013 RepID=A0ABR3FQS0_9AGAR